MLTMVVARCLLFTEMIKLELEIDAEMEGAT